MSRTNRRGISSYGAKGKRPFIYSPLYQQWRQALKEGRNHDAHRLSELHSKAFLGATYKPFDPMKTFSPDIRI